KNGERVKEKREQRSMPIHRYIDRQAASLFIMGRLCVAVLFALFIIPLMRPAALKPLFLSLSLSLSFYHSLSLCLSLFLIHSLALSLPLTFSGLHSFFPTLFLSPSLSLSRFLSLSLPFRVSDEKD